MRNNFTRAIIKRASILAIALIITVLSAVSMSAQTDLVVLEHPVPTYPAAAKAVLASGVVTCRVKINREGNVVKAEATSGHPLLKVTTENFLRQWKFNPIAEETERETIITMEYLGDTEKLVEFKNPFYVVIGLEPVKVDCTCCSDPVPQKSFFSKIGSFFKKVFA